MKKMLLGGWLLVAGPATCPGHTQTGQPSGDYASTKRIFYYVRDD